MVFGERTGKMSDGYTKLFADIVDSSIWDEDAEIRVVWVTLLALCNADGFVRGSVGWLAGKSRVSVNKCQQALTKFTSPDPRSRTPDNEGRRIQVVDYGWIVLNHHLFRNRTGLSYDTRRVYQRDWMRKKREILKSKHCQQSQPASTPASASASVTPEGGCKGETEITINMALKWLADWKRNGADYTEKEMRSAFLALQAGGWMWGRNPVADPRAALERQIQTDRNRKSATNGKAAPLDPHRPIGNGPL